MRDENDPAGLPSLDQHSDTVPPTPPALGPNRFLLIAGLAQVAAAFTPAGHVRVLGDILFVRLPTAGVALVVLGFLTSLIAFRPRGWWRWIPGILSVVLVAVVYWRLRWSPSGRFIDPLLRRAIRPSWGFIPMTIAALSTLVAASIQRKKNR